MQVILLERIDNLGQMGDTVKVKNGFARNYLLPQNKALRANKENLKLFEEQKAQLEAANLKRKKEAEKVGSKLNGTEVVLIRQASENGQLFGSVRSHDVREALVAEGFEVDKNQIMLSAPIKNIGLFPVRVRLHPEVDATISVNVAKTDDDAEQQRIADESLVQAVDTDEPAEKETKKVAKEDTNTEAATEASEESAEEESTDKESTAA